MAEYRVVVLGSCGVGKSAIVINFVQNKILLDYDSTIEDSYRKQVEIDDKISIINIIDTAGQELYSSVLDGNLIRGHAFVFVYDITNPDSFVAVKRLHNKLLLAKGMDDNSTVQTKLLEYSTSARRLSSQHARSHSRTRSLPDVKNPRDVTKTLESPRVRPLPIVLIGNKCDLMKERLVTYGEGHNLAREFGCAFYETSAIKTINIKEMFYHLVREIRSQEPEIPKDNRRCDIL